MSDVKSSAVLSPDGVYRYRLDRVWGAGPRVLFVMLNPSTADATQDDPTLRRCLGFARDWGYGSLTVANLYAYRARGPQAGRRPGRSGVRLLPGAVRRGGLADRRGLGDARPPRPSAAGAAPPRA
jgi:hypothetical protein